MANRITEVRLLAVPLEKDYKHTLYFTNADNQTAYFQSKTIHISTDFSYQRKEGYISFPKHYDDLQNCNYVMYRNAETSNKWYYAFITKMEYKSEEVTWIYFETDVLQTWMFDYTIKPSFVEREHVSDDTRGLHILEEGLQTGEYVCNLHSKAQWGDSTYYVIVGVSKVYAEKTNESLWYWTLGLLGKDEEWVQIIGDKYNGLFSGLKYRAFKYDDEAEMKNLLNMINFYDAAGYGEDIQCMFLAPAELIEKGSKPAGLHPDDTFEGWVANSDEVDTKYINKTTGDYSTITMKPSTINGYTPRNNKLWTYPYCYLVASNNNGVAVPYRFEDFSTTQPSFIIEGCLSPGCSVRLVPLNYKGASRNDEEGINLGKFPALNWTSDLYTNWVTQNSVNIGVDVAAGVLQVAAGVAGVAAAGATGGASLLMAGGIASGVTSIANTMAEVNKASFLPAQSKGNVNAGDVITMSEQNDFHFYSMSIKSQYAKIIDNYFDMFGYKVNDVKVPNKNHRQNYWFTKTIDVSIDGFIPQDDLQKIKDCYNNGITFWKNASNIGDYTVSNSIV